MVLSLKDGDEAIDLDSHAAVTKHLKNESDDNLEYREMMLSLSEKRRDLEFISITSSLFINIIALLKF